MSSDLQGRNGVVFGVANKRSIAWSIAQGLHAAGMKLAITYQNERLEQEAKDLILSLPGAEALHVRRQQGRRNRPPLRHAQRTPRQTAHAGALGRLRSRRRTQRRIPQHHARRLPHRAGCERVLAGSGRPRRRAAHGRRRIHHHDDLLRFRESRAPLQRDGRGQGWTRMFGALPRLRIWARRRSE